MRFYRCALLLLIGVALAQCGTEANVPVPNPTVAPRLDSIAIDEASGELQLFGQFDTLAELTVLCDSVSLQITARDPLSIRASIPESGKGSCGWVEVKSSELVSERKLITYWHFHHFWVRAESYSDGAYEFEAMKDTIYLRGDALSASLADRSLLITPIDRSFVHSVAHGSGGLRSEYNGPVYDTTTPARKIFQVNMRGANVGIFDPYFNSYLRFDGSGELIAYEKGYFGYDANGGRGGPLSSTRFPVQTR